MRHPSRPLEALARYGCVVDMDIAHLELPEAGGKTLRLGDLWAERPAVLVWLRHYG